ncbi:hypothetical protein FQN57_005689 [Myotisia sp. PD_48]|nr:hypothetical protein FQN57_005689 [Myotisia sp. PD_48]
MKFLTIAAFLGASANALYVSPHVARAEPDCPVNINGDHEFPHLIIPINSSAPDSAPGTSYLGEASSTISSLFNFDIGPQKNLDRCTLIFLMPNKEEWPLDRYIFQGDGLVSFGRLERPADKDTTFRNAPRVSVELARPTLAVGTNYRITSFPCPLGERIGFKLSSLGSTHIRFFQNARPPSFSLNNNPGHFTMDNKPDYNYDPGKQPLMAQDDDLRNYHYGSNHDALSLSTSPSPTYIPSSASQYQSLDPTSHFRTNFACISMNMTDRLRLIRFPAKVATEIVELVRSSWPKGIDDTRRYGESTEIKLKGNPWQPYAWNDDRTHSRQMLARVFDGMYNMGWVLNSPVAIGHVDSLLFRYQQPAPPPCEWMSISFHSSDRLRLIDTPTEFSLQLVEALGPLAQNSQTTGIAFEIKLEGYPWRASGTKTVEARVILLTIMEVLEQHGFSLYAPVNQDNRNANENSMVVPETWYCNRVRSWAQGQPVYHS